MDPMLAVDIGRQAIIITLIVSAPVLVAGLVVGVVVGIFQAVTQIHEMTLTFIPKILVMILVLLATLPWMMIQVVDYTINLFNVIPSIMR
jgi:flagellar biosynthetic protein FliQ